MRLLLFCLTSLALLLPRTPANAQCNACTPDPSCTSADGFPTICPDLLPDAETDTPYEQIITFFLPAEVTDPGSGAVADLESVTITAIQGVPQGLTVELNDPDGVYEPASGQTSGCATLCGTPVWPGDFVITISISAIASLFGFEQTVNESFTYDLHIEAGPGGTGTFTASATSGCDSLTVDFVATAAGTPAQTTSYNWNFGNGETSSADSVTVTYTTPGTYTTTLTTDIAENVLTSIIINSTGGAGFDDLFTPPDLYFILTNGSGTTVYTSSVVADNNNPSWTNLSIPVNNPPYNIAFWDEDAIGSDDNMGSGALITAVTGPNSFAANPTFGQSYISLNTVLTLTDSITITVAGPPDLPAPVSTPDLMHAPVDSMLQFNWFSGDSLLVSGPDSTFLPPANGWYGYKAVSSTGCTGTSDTTLFCGLTPAVGLDLATDEFTGEPLSLMANEALTTWVWWDADATAPTDTTDTPVFFPAVSGWYAAAGFDSFGCPAAAESLLVCWPLPDLTIFQDLDGDLVTAEGFDIYTWFQDDLPLPGGDWWLPAPGPGVYTVAATDHPDCPVTASAPWTYVGLPQPFQQANVQVFPNPFSDQIHLTPPPTSPTWTAELLAPDGRLITRQGPTTGPAILTLPEPNASTGLHILVLRDAVTGQPLFTTTLIRTP